MTHTQPRMSQSHSCSLQDQIECIPLGLFTDVSNPDKGFYQPLKLVISELQPTSIEVTNRQSVALNGAVIA